MIKLVNVTKCFSDGSNVRYIFKNCNFEFKKGSTTAIVGRSGLGKTTLVKLILGITSLNEGDILVCGSSVLDMKNLSKVRRRNIGCVFQNFNLISGFTVKENILLPRYFFENGENNINEICNTLGLSKEMLSKSIDKISGGEKQRVALARALINNPEILIADEPTTALDVTIQAQILDLIADLQEEIKAGIILITHDLGVVAQIADRVAVMYAGEIVELATSKEIFTNPLHPYTRSLLKSIPQLDTNENDELHVIKGMVPSLKNLPRKGCRFSARIPYIPKEAHEENPGFHEAFPGHLVRCTCWKTFKFEENDKK